MAAVSTTPEVDNLMAAVGEEVVKAMTSRAVEVEADGKPVSGPTTARTCALAYNVNERNDSMTEQTNSTDDSYRIRCAKFFGSYN